MLKRILWLFAMLCPLLCTQQSQAWTVYFDNSVTKYETPTIYMWGDNVIASCTYMTRVGDGNIWKYDYTGSLNYTKVIFRKNLDEWTPQSVDCTVQDGYLYTPQNSNDKYQVTTTYYGYADGIYLGCGNGSFWKIDDTDGDGIYTYTGFSYNKAGDNTDPTKYRVQTFSKETGWAYYTASGGPNETNWWYSEANTWNDLGKTTNSNAYFCINISANPVDVYVKTENGVPTAISFGAVIEKTHKLNMPLKKKDFAGGKKHYFLVGTRSADWRLQPEWELHDDGTGTYSLSKRLYYTGHMGIAVVDNYDDYCNQTYKLYSNTTLADNYIKTDHNTVALSVQNSGNTVKCDPSTQNYTQFAPWSQIRFVYSTDCGAEQNKTDDATVLKCDPTLADVKITLDADGLPTKVEFYNVATDAATTNKYLTWSIVGSMTTNDLASTSDAVAPYNGNNWDQGWIQYDENGEPYVDGDGHYIYQTCYQYNEWLKEHPTYFTYDGHEFSSTNLLLHYDDSRNYTTLPPEGSTLYENYTNNSTWTDITSTGLTATNTTAGNTYAYYVCDDMFLHGSFKLWTGWGGVDKMDDGTWTGNTGDKNETRWYYRNAGHYYGADQSLASNSAYYHTAIDVNNANFKMDNLTYFKRIEFYLDPSTDSYGATAINNSAIHFYQELITPQIVAQRSGKNQISFDPSMANIDQSAKDYDVTGITIKRYVVNTDGTRTVQDEKVVVANPENLKSGDLDTYLSNLSIDKTSTGYYIDEDYMYPGLYQYEIIIDYTDGDGNAQQASSFSNQVRIYQTTVPENVTAEQRTETLTVNEGTTTKTYTAYSFDYEVTAGMPESLLTETYDNGETTDYVGKLVQGYEIAITGTDGSPLDVTNFQGVIIGDEEYDFKNLVNLTDNVTLTDGYEIKDKDGNVVATLKQNTTTSGETYYSIVVMPENTVTYDASGATTPDEDSWKMPKVTFVNLNAGSDDTPYTGDALTFTVSMTAKDGDTKQWETLGVDTKAVTADFTVPAFSFKVGDLAVSSVANYTRDAEGTFGGYIYDAGQGMYAPGFDASDPCVQYRRVNVLQDPITVSVLPVTESVLCTFNIVRGFSTSATDYLYKGYAPAAKTNATGLYQRATTRLNVDEYNGMKATVEVPTADKALTAYLSTSDANAQKMAQEIGTDGPTMQQLTDGTDARNYSISTTYSKNQLTVGTLNEGFAGKQTITPAGFAYEVTLQAPTATAIETAMKAANGGKGLAFGSADGYSAKVEKVENYAYNTYNHDDNGKAVNPVKTYDTFFNITSDDLIRPVNLGAQSTQLAVGISAYASNFFVLDHPEAPLPQNYKKGGLVTAIEWTESGSMHYSEYNYDLNGNLTDTESDSEAASSKTFTDYMATGYYSFSDLAEANGKLPMRLVCSGEGTLSGSSNLSLYVLLLTQYPFIDLTQATDEGAVTVSTATAKAPATGKQADNLTVVTYTADWTTSNPGNGNDNDFLVTIDPLITGVSDVQVQNGQLQVWPNPCHDVVNVAAGSGLGTVELYSVAGQLLKAVNTSDTQTQVSVADLPAGIYVLRAAGTATRLVVK